MAYKYVNSNGDTVSGSAAYLHLVYTEYGGTENYEKAIGTAYIQAFVDAHSAEVSEAIEKAARKNSFKVI